MSWGITLGKPRTQNANRQNSACFLPAKRLVFFFQAKARVVDRVVSFAAVFWECHAGGALRDIPTAKGSERQAESRARYGTPGTIPAVHVLLAQNFRRKKKQIKIIV